MSDIKQQEVEGGEAALPLLRSTAAKPVVTAGDIITRYGTVFALVAVVIVFAILAPKFFTSGNIINVLRQISPLTIVAIGLTICIASGEFDLSQGTIASLAGILVTGLVVRQEQSFALACVVAILAGTILGLLSGFFVTRMRVPSLIATMGVSAFAVGINFAYAKGDSIYGRMPDAFDFIGRGFVGPIPFSVIVAAVLSVLLFVFLNYTVIGRNILATGGNPVAAKLTGIKISRYRLIGLIISGTCAGIAGIVLTAFLGTGQPNGADAYSMDALAAVFLGMTTIRPGQANLLGTIVGVLILGILNNGLNLVGAPFYMQNIVRGGMLVLSVSLAVYREEIRFF
jgi:ribose transport system permease protein